MRHEKIGFLGLGNMNSAIIEALVASGFAKTQIYGTDKSEARCARTAQRFGIHIVKNNEDLCEPCDIVILGVKPQDLESALESMSTGFSEEHVIVSIAAGVPINTLQNWLPQGARLVRLMPNTAARLRKAVIGYCLATPSEALTELIEDLFSPMGLVVPVEEGEMFEALTVAASSGIGFVLELMVYWQEWLEEHGFDSATSRQIAVQTFGGACALAAEGRELMELQNQVVSKKGVTAAGLDSMRELEVERGLRYSFEKAVLRDRMLGKP